MSLLEEQQQFAKALGYPTYAAYLEATGAAPWATAAAGSPGASIAYAETTPQTWAADLARLSAQQGIPLDKSITMGTTGPGSGIAGAGLPAALVGGLGAIGLGSVIAPVGAAYGLAQLLGLQMPWETGAGEGFIAPWTRPQVRDEQGLWVTAATRPDLFAGQGSSQALAVMGAGALGGTMVRKIWNNASKDGRVPATVESVMLTNGTVITRSLITGEIKKHRPKKHIVISSNPRLSSLAKLDRVQKRVSKMVRKYAPRKKSVQAPSDYLSAAERKLLKRA